MSERSRSISPSTSIRTRGSHSTDGSDCVDSGLNSRYAGLSEEELMNIWERRNLAYFDRRQRLLAEERERQQQQGQQGDDMSGEEESTNQSIEEEQQAPLASVQVGQQQQHLTRPRGFISAAESPTWREMTSRNIMGEWDPERAAREPAYRTAWMSCERLVAMNRPGADSGNFVPSNPRLAALLESRRVEVAQERLEEERALRQQQQQQEGQSTLHQGVAAARQGMDVEGHGANPPGEIIINRGRSAQQQGPPCGDSLQSSSSGSSSDKSSKSSGQNSQQPYYLALPYPTPKLTKPVNCSYCNCALYTIPIARRFFCQTCGRLSDIRKGEADAEEAFFEGKMQDAEDQDISMSS